MKPKTEELLYLLLWSCEKLTRPTFRNLTDSFEGWAYRNGLHRQLAELERRKFLETQALTNDSTAGSARALRLTETGRLHTLGGRDPDSRWKRRWDGRWRLVLFDLPVAQSAARDRLRRYLRLRGFGHLQNSVWISPDPLQDEKTILAGSRVNVESLLLLEARPCAGESDQEIVAGAWDFAAINRGYGRHIRVLDRRPAQPLRDAAAARSLRQWAAAERQAWLAAVGKDPLLPEALLPQGYLGREAWQRRAKTLNAAANQVRSFGKAVEGFA